MSCTEWNNALRCPLCHAPLFFDGGSFFCRGERKHTFDMSGAGYVNMNTHLPNSGDSKEMAKARQTFLHSGAYAPLADAIVSHCKGGEILVDAGCGEGYYTEAAAANFERVLGADLSKYALALAGKHAKGAGLSDKILYSAASVYDLPLRDGVCDCVTNIFAPCVENEFCRVLKNGGTLITAAAGRNHLYELKSILYDEVIPNETRRDYPQNMRLAETIPLEYRANISKENIYPLFTMTPYFYRTKKERAECLYELPSLDVTLDFEIRIYIKEESNA